MIKDKTKRNERSRAEGFFIFKSYWTPKLFFRFEKTEIATPNFNNFGISKFRRIKE